MNFITILITCSTFSQVHSLFPSLEQLICCPINTITTTPTTASCTKWCSSLHSSTSSQHNSTSPFLTLPPNILTPQYPPPPHPHPGMPHPPPTLPVQLWSPACPSPPPPPHLIKHRRHNKSHQLCSGHPSHMRHQLLLPPLLAANHLFDRHRLQFISSHSQQNLLISSDSNPASCCSAFCLSSTLQCLWNQFSMFFLKQNTNFHVEQNWKLTCTRVSYCVEYIYVGRMGGKYYSSRSKLERGWQ